MAATSSVREAKTLTSQQDASLCSTLTDEQETMIREVISRVTDKWSLWALSELAQHGPLRFSRLMERVEGVSQKSLTATLRHLERDGLIKRTVMVQVPIRVDYDATDLGRAMVAEVHPLWMWVAVNLQGVARARHSFDRRTRVQQPPKLASAIDIESVTSPQQQQPTNARATPVGRQFVG